MLNFALSARQPFDTGRRRLAVLQARCDETLALATARLDLQRHGTESLAGRLADTRALVQLLNRVVWVFFGFLALGGQVRGRRLAVLQARCDETLALATARLDLQRHDTESLAGRLADTRALVQLLTRVVNLRKASIEEKSGQLKDRASSCRHSKQRCEQLARFLSKVAKERTYRSQRNEKVRDRVADRVDQLSRVRHRLAHAALTYVFPINVIRHEGLLAASVLTHHAPPSTHVEAAVADATATTFNGGRWKIDNPTALAKVPTNIAASVSSILIGYCRFTEDRSVLQQLPDCLAGLAYAAQFIRLLAAIFDVVLPFRVTYAEICLAAGHNSNALLMTSGQQIQQKNMPKATMSPALVGLYSVIQDTPTIPVVTHPASNAVGPVVALARNEGQMEQKNLLVELSSKLHANLAFIAVALASSKDEANSIRVSSPVHSICVLLSFLNTFPASCKSLLLASNIYGGGSEKGNLLTEQLVAVQTPIIINSTLQEDLDSIKNLESSTSEGFADLYYDESENVGDNGVVPSNSSPSNGGKPGAPAVGYPAEYLVDDSPFQRDWETVEDGDFVPEYCPPPTTTTAVPRLTNSVSTFLRNLTDLGLTE